MKNTETIKINLNKDFKNVLIFKVRHAYGNIEFEKAILKILEDWVAESELQPVSDEEIYEEPIAYAVALPKKQKVLFNIAMPAVQAGILDPDYEINWLQWDGNVLENIAKARAQVMHILELKDYHALGKKLFENILSTAVNMKEVM